MSEHIQQSLLFDILRLNEQKYPYLKYIFAVPNGGARHPATAAKLKREGVKKGVWDIFVPIVLKNHPGMFIEMKYGRNTLTDEQKEFSGFASAGGYKMAVCYSALDAIKEIENYLKIRLSK